MNGGAVANPNPPPAAATSLAPGFRFHPTDEELVSYYLKRKVAGRPLRVDAIAEVDLYKCEPWDLPGRSRIRSRDVEWYFFSPLDRKYSNRSRTNRATAEGYWKTTGKDRPVRNGPRQVGMKKTLVFHVGRAPRGKRTNWVMHEYRIEEEEERPQAAAISQDAYVVCRIFQKCGAGPQNGAQYGAPFVEEEWEDEAADQLAVMPDGGEDEYVDAGNPEYLQYNDFEQIQNLESHQADVHAMVGDPAIQEGGNCVHDTAIQEGGNSVDDADALLNELFSEPNFINELVECINEPGEYSGLTLADDIERKPYTGDSAHVSTIQNDEYVEMNDLADLFNFECPLSEDSVSYPLRNYCEKNSPDGRDESGNLHTLLEVDEFFGTNSQTLEEPESIQAYPVHDTTDLQINDFGQQAGDDVVFYDAPDDILDSREDKFPSLDEILNSPIAERSDFEMLDDILAYYDATDSHVHTMVFPEEIGYLNSSVMCEPKVAKEVIDPKDAGDASTSAIFEPDNHFKNINEDFTVASDDGGRDKTTIAKRLVNMLGSIAAPPAFAAEIPSGSGKSVEHISPSHSTSSIHVTTGLIHIHDVTISSSSGSWPLQKNGDLGFLLSYSLTDDVVRKCACEEQITKIPCGALTVVLRGGFSLFCVSAIILGLSYRLGMCIYGR